MMAVATITATSAVTGNVSLVCVAASVITPVIVPGLAANMISGASDTFSELSCGADLLSVELPRNIVNPIQDNTPPPATEKASSETPNMCKIRVPNNAASDRIISTANAA